MFSLTRYYSINLSSPELQITFNGNIFDTCFLHKEFLSTKVIFQPIISNITIYDSIETKGNCTANSFSLLQLQLTPLNLIKRRRIKSSTTSSHRNFTAYLLSHHIDCHHERRTTHQKTKAHAQPHHQRSHPPTKQTTPRHSQIHPLFSPLTSKIFRPRTLSRLLLQQYSNAQTPSR